MLVRESLEFRRGQDSKRALRVGSYSKSPEEIQLEVEEIMKKWRPYEIEINDDIWEWSLYNIPDGMKLEMDRDLTMPYYSNLGVFLNRDEDRLTIYFIDDDDRLGSTSYQYKNPVSTLDEIYQILDNPNFSLKKDWNRF